MFVRDVLSLQDVLIWVLVGSWGLQESLIQRIQGVLIALMAAMAGQVVLSPLNNLSAHLLSQASWENTLLIFSPLWHDYTYAVSLGRVGYQFQKPLPLALFADIFFLFKFVVWSKVVTCYVFPSRFSPKASPGHERSTTIDSVISPKPVRQGCAWLL